MTASKGRGEGRWHWRMHRLQLAATLLFLPC